MRSMKRLPLYLLALTTLVSSAAQAQAVSYVLVPTITPGVTLTKVEMLRSNFSITDVHAMFVGEGKSALDSTPRTLKAYIGPSPSRANPLLDLSPIASSGGMVILQPVPGLSTVEVSFEVEQNPVRTAWKLPLLSADDFFAAGSTVYVLNLVKQTDASSNLQLFNIGATAATCDVKVLRPKGSVLDERVQQVPAVGVARIADILRNVSVASASGINAAVTCNQPLYALGALPAKNRCATRVQFPVTQAPGATTAVTLGHRPGTFFKVNKTVSDLHIPLTLEAGVAYHTLAINFDVAVADPPNFVVFRNVIAMFRFGARRFGKTLFFGSFEK